MPTNKPINVAEIDTIRSLLAEGARQTTLEEAVEAFLRIEMSGKSDQTRTWYRRCLSPIVHEIGGTRPLSDLMEIDLIEWYERLCQRGERYPGGKSRPRLDGPPAAETIRGYIRAVRRFFGWLKQRGVLEVDLSANIKPPRKPKRKKKGISEPDAEMILRAASENLRDFAIIKFMETAGVRRGGVANLLLSDLNLEAVEERYQRRVTVREKGNKERVVFTTPAGLDAIRAWLDIRPQIDDDHVFLGQRLGEPWRPLSPDGISAILSRYKKRLEITGRVSPHQWRHRFCRKRLQNGMNLKQVSQLAGHESIVVTAEFYSDVDDDELQAAYDEHFK